ncbi:cytochrome c oxidase accessory protein CcoG [Aquabacterium sp. OR-4]|uniref:cytochrome c oxidase accessory protein CcoG n=1 Tax=Aquabacterium sp. OR-4 TaxID=2978127 RepID=UPI0028C86E12|nr:cytochrome c oxidase accessory protein CcoG [Aquabacterium sp. OR-4]MDT7835309.1 cytochrome c oxidase accessory protein CcoG [Aquabacterium sp. OR-4]
MSETTGTTASAGATLAEDSSTAVVSLYQKQRKIYPRAVSGLFMRWRWGLVWFTQLLFYGLPWLSWNARQFVLFDLGARRFYIGPLVLYPQDFIFLTAILIISAYALFLFTAVAGRLWCGYACPQTVYTEIFMWVEHKIEGDRIARMRLDDGPWNFNKLWRKSAKQIAWVVIGLWTGFTFVGYFTPIHTLLGSAATLGLGPWEWFWVLFYGFATYGNAGFMREQVCKYMCPYARFQSAMFDKDTLIISYDSERGDPRGSRSKKADPRKLGLGDCVDCGLCVQVCPTGIDIRKGLQYECIGCAACVDVCDEVMGKMGYAKGLVRFDTQNGLAQHLSRGQKLRRIFRPRVLVYTAILGLVVLALLAALALRHPFRVDVVRDRATLARMVEDGRIENVYRLQIMNATEQPQRLRLAVQGLPGITLGAVPELHLASAEARWVTVSVQVPAEAAQQAGPGAHPIHFEIGLIEADRRGADASGAALSEKSTFVVPR